MPIPLKYLKWSDTNWTYVVHILECLNVYILRTGKEASPHFKWTVTNEMIAQRLVSADQMELKFPIS